MSVKSVAVRGLVAMASLVAVQLAAVQPAAAQYYPYPGEYGVMSPYAVHATLRAHGLRPVTQPVQTGAYVVVRAVDEVGEMVRVLINARYGNIIQVTPLPPAPVVGQPVYRPYGPPPDRAYPPPPPRYGAARPALKVEPAPQGPSDPYDGYNALEQRSAVTPPPPAARTPMPPPRPAIAAAAAPTTANAEAVEPRAAPAPATTGATAKPQAFPPAAPLE